MNKTVSIHIQGFAFILEEQAYEVLRKYLNDLSTILQHEEGKDEILQDIELRIVELLQAKVNAQQVVQLEQIQEIIQLLGSPDAFSDDEAKQTDYTKFESAEPIAPHKRFFRDSDHPILGGVAGGVAAYFNVDVVFVRVAFVLFTMAFGSGIPIYIILWIVTPRALSASDKLQMRGRAVNVENIKTEFKEAAERVEKKTHKWSQQLKTGSNLSNGLGRLANFIKKVLGLILVLKGLSILIALSIFIFVDPGFPGIGLMNGEFTSLGALSKLFFETNQLHRFIYVGASLIGYAISFASLLTGIRLLFSFEAKWLRAGYLLFGVAVIVGIALLAFVGFSTGKSFAVEGELSKEIGTFAGDSLKLDILIGSGFQSTSTQQENAYRLGYKPIKYQEQGLLLVKNGRIYSSGVSMRYITSSDSLYHISVLKKANGSSYYKANLRASHINFPCQLKGSIVSLASGISYPVKDRIRDQEVELQIAVPRGKIVLNQGKVIYPYFSLEESEEASDRAYINSDGQYSAW